LTVDPPGDDSIKVVVFTVTFDVEIQVQIIGDPIRRDPFVGCRRVKRTRLNLPANMRLEHVILVIAEVFALPLVYGRLIPEIGNVV
jgi:hypothetical protein